MINSDSLIKISGSIGMVVLENIKTNKKIFMFYDDHSNKKYCTSSNSVFLYDLIEKFKKNNQDTIVLLEEPFVNNYSNIKFLWNDTPHIIKFRNFYKKIMNKCSLNKICYTFPVDIRLCLCDISIDELYLNINNKSYWEDYNIDVKEYFKYLLYLFNKESITKESFQNDKDTNILFLKRVFDTFTNTKYYAKLNEKFNQIYDKFILPNIKISINEFINKYKEDIFTFEKGYPFENINNNIFQDQYDKLVNGIMEYYTCILIFGLGYKNNIIYTGYYHGNNITYILKKYYNFKEIYNTGATNNIENSNESLIQNCLHIDKNIFNN